MPSTFLADTIIMINGLNRGIGKNQKEEEEEPQSVEERELV